MRRAIVALLGTAAGTTLLVGVKAGLLERPVAASATTNVSHPTGTAGSPGAAGAAPGAMAGTAPAGAGARAAPAPAGAGGLRDGVFTGPLVTTQYGPVQVRVTVRSGRLSDVAAVALPSAQQHSVLISGRAGPMLRQEALTAQSATIQAVSGATYTSRGYLTSLQAALDAAKRA